jgi:outer membrane protein OmpA-like peptidoglycan-associated protein
MIKYVLAALLLFSSWAISAQVELGECEQAKSEKADVQIQKALKAINAKDLKMANIYVNNAQKMQANNAHAFYLEGEIAMRYGNLLKAEAAWTQCLNVCPDYKPDLYFFLGINYLESGKKQKAEEYLTKFITMPGRERGYDKEAKAALKEIHLEENLMSNPVPFDPRPVKAISTTADEYLAIISPDEELCFFTRRQKKVDKYAGPSGTPRVVEEFTMATKNGSIFTTGDALTQPFNENFNEGGATVTANNSEMFFTVCVIDKDGYQNCDLYYTRKDFGHWGDIVPMGDHINTPKTWESQPSVSANGDVLYFTSNRPGGKGGLDIWVCYRQPNGDWQAPVNLGDAINTRKNEKSPFIHSDSQTLYFASDGHPTLGGYDIYFTKKDDVTKEWFEPTNIGYPINTKADEIGLFVSLNGKKGYFNSNKLKGVGGWDLYEFDLYELARPEKVALVKGTLKDENNQVVTDATLEVKNLKTKEITQIKVDQSTGEFATVIQLKEKENVIIKVNKDGAAFTSTFVDASDETSSGVIKSEMRVEEIKVGREYRINDIHFATNSYELSENSKQIIDEFIIFLNQNPKITFDIQGHTDDVGDDSANLALSVNRARVVNEYLLANGIAQRRLTYHGYGETRPIASNATEEGRSENRRTVFVITGR